MPNQLLTVDSVSHDLPQVVKDKLAEYFATIQNANTIAEAKASQYVNLNSSVDALVDKLVKRDAQARFAIVNAVDANHPVSLEQLDARIPASGIPLASQVDPGLMSTTDKYKLDNQFMRRPLPTGTALKDLTPNTVYFYDNIAALDRGHPEFTASMMKGELFVYPTISPGRAYLNVSFDGIVESAIDNGGTATLNDSSWSRKSGYPLASASNHGLFSSTDFSTLNNATASLVNSALVRRDTNGRFAAADPTISSHVATKGYSDNASNLSSGTVNKARLKIQYGSISTFTTTDGTYGSYTRRFDATIANPFGTSISYPVACFGVGSTDVYRFSPIEINGSGGNITVRYYGPSVSATPVRYFIGEF